MSTGETFYLFTEADRRILRDLIDRERKNPIGRITKDGDKHDLQAMDVHIVKVPDAGLPPLGLDALFTGTGTSDWDYIESVLCDVYQPRFNMGRNKTDLIAVEGYQIPVHNLSRVLVSRGYVRASRERYGVWIVEDPGISKIVGKFNEAVTYGSSKPFTVWENDVATERIEIVYFTWMGQSGQIIGADVKAEAEWRWHLNDFQGAWVVTNANCNPTTGTGTS